MKEPWISLHQDDFKSKVTWQVLLHHVGVPKNDRPYVDQVNVEIKSFETWKEDE